MEKINNKGFAISTMLYGLLIIIVLVILMILSIMAFSRKNSKEFSETIVDRLEKIKNYNFTNKNIRAAYTYNPATCVTGDEDTCEQISITKDDNNIPAGTIIKYAVNNTDIVTFHVMFDNGNTLTMQSQQNILKNIPWFYANVNINTNGPLSSLLALENATAGWTNVNNQTYTMGTTVFQTNAFTGCRYYNSCSTNMYTLPTRTAKARMITLQEAAKLGCTQNIQTCPIWMNNYLASSTHYGGTVNDNNTAGGFSSDYGYWTMSVDWYDYAIAWLISYEGCLRYDLTKSNSLGLRAVVVINK